MRANALRDAIHKSRSLLGALLDYAHAFLNQTTRTAVANGRSKIEERLARWLLMAHDRVRSPELPLTHEFLAMMLAVRRAGVTTAVQHLENEAVIARRRGRIVICNREKLEKLANGTYIAANEEHGETNRGRGGLRRGQKTTVRRGQRFVEPAKARTSTERGARNF
jgi:hypothetical protein